jgi:drug/metabolite transporter (DMT)-like permease
MKQRSLADLFALAAIWGASYLFMRWSAPDFGAPALAAVRVLGACGLLLPLALSRGHGPAMRQHAPALVAVGLVGSALPFVLYAYAALSLPAALSAVFNASTPLFGAAVAWLWLGESLSRGRALGLAIGFAGVLGLAWSRVGPTSLSWNSPALAVGACLLSTLLYGLGASMTRRYLQGVAPLAVAAGSLGGSCLLLLPLGLAYPPPSMPSAGAWLSAAGLAFLCTGVAFVLFFRLIGEVGAGPAMSVTYLIPVFAMLWGYLFLGERVSAEMALGCGVILLGTTLASGAVRLRSDPR